MIEKNKIIRRYHNWWRFANQYRAYIHLLWYSIENNANLRVYCLREYAHLFINATSIEKIYWYIRNKTHWNTHKIFVHWIRVIYIWFVKFFISPKKLLNDKRDLAYTTKYINNWVWWWRFRANNEVLCYRKIILKRLRFKKIVESKHISKLKLNNCKVIWIHYRQWDYNLYNSWKHYISHNWVLKVLDVIEKYFFEKWKNVWFIIASNWDITSILEKRSNVYRSEWSIDGDIQILSSCDAIIWSNSTFWPLWAYIWDIPILLIENILNKTTRLEEIKLLSKWEFFHNFAFTTLY